MHQSTSNSNFNLSTVCAKEQTVFLVQHDSPKQHNCVRNKERSLRQFKIDLPRNRTMSGEDQFFLYNTTVLSNLIAFETKRERTDYSRPPAQSNNVGQLSVGGHWVLGLHAVLDGKNHLDLIKLMTVTKRPYSYIVILQRRQSSAVARGGTGGGPCPPPQFFS